MAASKIAISINSRLLGELDELVNEHKFASRSHAIQQAVEEQLTRVRKTRLIRECAKLNPQEERELANEYLAAETEWPEY